MNEECISVTFGCLWFIDSYRFLSSILDSIVKTLVDKKHETLQNFKKEDVEDAIMINIVNKRETIISEVKTNDDLKESFPDKNEKLEEALNKHLSEKERKIWNQNFLISGIVYVRN